MMAHHVDDCQVGEMGEEGYRVAINQGRDKAVSDSAAYHSTIHGFDVSDWPTAASYLTTSRWTASQDLRSSRL